jgi:hypothetical protein
VRKYEIRIFSTIQILARSKLFFLLFSSPCQRQDELLPSLGVRRPLTFHILIFSSDRVEDFLEINQSETRIACGGHVC